MEATIPTTDTAKKAKIKITNILSINFLPEFFVYGMLSIF